MTKNTSVQPVNHQHQPPERLLARDRDSKSSRQASRLAAGRTAGRDWPSRAAGCSSSIPVNASRVSWAASGAVMKNDTIRTRSATSGGGRSTNVDNSADLPAHGPARHHVYGAPSGSRQNRASSASSASRSSKPGGSGGAIPRPSSRYAQRGPDQDPAAPALSSRQSLRDTIGASGAGAWSLRPGSGLGARQDAGYGQWLARPGWEGPGGPWLMCTSPATWPNAIPRPPPSARW